MSYPSWRQDAYFTSNPFSQFSDRVHREARQLKRLIGNRRRWVKGLAAENDRGHACDPASPDAACWCLTGGFDALEVSQDTREAVGAAIRDLFPGRWNGSITGFNDDPATTIEDIRTVLDYAAKA